MHPTNNVLFSEPIVLPKMRLSNISNHRSFVFVCFSIIARGARGGKGADGMGISKGATAIAVVELSKHQKLHILVGQEGGDACRKVRVFEILK